MNKYINTEDLHKVVLKRKVEYGSLADLIDSIVEKMVKDTLYADVVERSEYIESQKEVMRLRDLCHRVNQDAMHYEEMYKELHSKVDKAIEEIKGLIEGSKLPTVNIYNKYSEGLEDCLEILKRNIGE